MANLDKLSMNHAESQPMPHRILELFDKPFFSLLGASGAWLVAIMAEAAQAVPSWVAEATGYLALGTGVLLFLKHIRGTVIQFLHDLKSFRRGKLPPVEKKEE